jgi:hypothetical protein
MRNRGAVVAVVVMCSSCFSTARYDRAHIERVSSINARHDAALEREREHHASVLAELDRRRALAIPVDPDAGGAPLHRVDRRDIAWLTTQLSLSIDADLESILARAHNQAVLADIDRQAALLAQHHARARGRIEQQREHDLRVSTQQRDIEISAGRAARRARVKAAADAFAAEARGQPAAPASTPPSGPTAAIGCSDQRDCPHGMSCDRNTGVCCATLVR